MSARYARVADLEVERSGDQVFVTVAAGTWLLLEGGAMAIWDALDEPRSFDELRRYVTERFAGSPKQIVHDLEDVLTECEERGIITVRYEET